MIHVRRLPVPNLRSSMALEMYSMRSTDERMSGMQSSAAAFTRLLSRPFLDISMPRACWLWEMS